MKDYKKLKKMANWLKLQDKNLNRLGGVSDGNPGFTLGYNLELP